MLDLLKAVIFGVVQGITEFLPVSSSGHLVILHDFLKIPVANEPAFDVVLHAATLIAVVYYFRKEVMALALAWLRSIGGESSKEGRVAWLIILGTIPAAAAGFFWGGAIENSLRSALVVAFMLVFVGLLFIVVEKLSKKIINYQDIGWRKVLVIGLAQAIALIPGTSRSGITMIAGLGVGLNRESAIKFSFLLSIPIILGAVLTKLPAMLSTGISSNELSIIITAFISSLVSGFLAIKYLLIYSRNHSLNIFAYYRFALAALILIGLIFM